MLELIQYHIIPAAYATLPVPLQTLEATAMMLAIGLQESKFEHRRQLGKGPANGFWQFEEGGGCKGVITHPKSAGLLRGSLQWLRYNDLMPAPVLHQVILHNDVVAAVCARLLLYTDPHPLPKRHQAMESWDYYVRNWRPGKPHPETWDDYYAQAWERVQPMGAQPPKQLKA